MPSVVKVTVQDRFAAMTRGFEVGLGEYARAGSFPKELREIRQLLFPYAARYRDVLVGEFGLHLSDANIASVNPDFLTGTRVGRRSYRHQVVVPERSAHAGSKYSRFSNAEISEDSLAQPLIGLEGSSSRWCFNQ